MTSPVQMDMGKEPTMSFFMPGYMEPKDYPTPNNKEVMIHTQPSKIVAVIEFSGWASDEVLQKQFNKLQHKKLLMQKRLQMMQRLNRQKKLQNFKRFKMS